MIISNFSKGRLNPFKEGSQTLKNTGSISWTTMTMMMMMMVTIIFNFISAKKLWIFKWLTFPFNIEQKKRPLNRKKGMSRRPIEEFEREKCLMLWDVKVETRSAQTPENRIHILISAHPAWRFWNPGSDGSPPPPHPLKTVAEVTIATGSVQVEGVLPDRGGSWEWRRRCFHHGNGLSVLQPKRHSCDPGYARRRHTHTHTFLIHRVIPDLRNGTENRL